MRRLALLAPILAVALALLPAPSPEPPTHPGPSVSPLPAIVALVVGDSQSVAPSYTQELGRLMTKTGQPHTWRVAAMPGSTCHHWALYLDAAIVANNPGLIFLNCGTNDDPTRDNTEADYRTILAVAAARGVPLVASLIGNPDMRTDTNRVRPYILDWMHAANQAIRRAVSAFPGTPLADMQRIPANLEWLKSDGIHWTARAAAAAGQLFYQAARLIVAGWKTLAQLGVYEMCGLSGSWWQDPEPIPDVAYRMCRN